jgi:hypothetical protein
MPFMALSGVGGMQGVVAQHHLEARARRWAMRRATSSE